MIVLLVALMAVFGSACTGGHTSLSPAVFMMTVKHVKCQEGPMPTVACFDVTITNQGQEAGDGRCQLTGSLNGNQTAGQMFTVRGLAPGASVRRYARWTTSPPQAGYFGACTPGPAS